MKKLSALLLAISLAVSMTACGEQPEAVEDTVPETEPEQAETVPEVTEEPFTIDELDPDKFPGTFAELGVAYDFDCYNRDTPYDSIPGKVIFTSYERTPSETQPGMDEISAIMRVEVYPESPSQRWGYQWFAIDYATAEDNIIAAGEDNTDIIYNLEYSEWLYDSLENMYFCDNYFSIIIPEDNSNWVWGIEHHKASDVDLVISEDSVYLRLVDVEN